MFDDILKQLMSFSPEKVYLFGSFAKGCATEHSDIDICIVANTKNKRGLLADLYYEIDCDRPIDFLIYTPDEWEECIADQSSFAHKIQKEGVLLFG
ncbi:MAG: nucleotidyltransferase domain-containing protein [Clostridia bacterium]|nr:nucleotidyltransferase domain-containing protein [Clostridia bacterium]